MVHDASIRMAQLGCQLRVDPIQLPCSLGKGSIVVETQRGNDALEPRQAIQI
jgi:hypothetical protein